MFCLKDSAEYYGEFDFNVYLGSDVGAGDIGHILDEQYIRKDLEFYPFKNDPCPCGSGKKYKKCYGKPTFTIIK